MSITMTEHNTEPYPEPPETERPRFRIPVKVYVIGGILLASIILSHFLQPEITETISRAVAPSSPLMQQAEKASSKFAPPGIAETPATPATTPIPDAAPADNIPAPPPTVTDTETPPPPAAPEATVPPSPEPAPMATTITDGRLWQLMTEQMEIQKTESGKKLESLQQERNLARQQSALWECLARLERGGDLDTPLQFCRVAATGRSDIQGILDGLTLFADSELLTDDLLTALFSDAIPDALHVKAEADETPPWWRQALGNISAQVTIRKTGNISGDSAEAIIARAEYQLQQGSIGEAVRLINTLPAANRQPFDAWLEAANARIAYDNTRVSLRAALTYPMTGAE